MLLMANSIEMTAALNAVWATGAQVAPINPFLTPSELKKQLGDVQACAIISDKASEEKGSASRRAVQHSEQADARRRRHDARRLESRPVAAARSLAFAETRRLRAADLHGRLDGRAEGRQSHAPRVADSVLQHVTVWPCKFGEERFLNVAPMFHIWGLGYSTLVPIYAQSTLVMVPRYDAGQSRARAFRPQDHRLRRRPRADLHGNALRAPRSRRPIFRICSYCLVGRRAVPRRAASRVAREDGPADSRRSGHDGRRAVLPQRHSGGYAQAAVGRQPVPGTELQVVDLETATALPQGERGELRVRGPQMGAGYRNQPEETARTYRDGWCTRATSADVDEEGFVFLVDRKKDMVIVGGYNVYPREVDEVLFKHPKIREAATVGKPDPRLGEVLVAFVVLDAGAAADGRRILRVLQGRDGQVQAARRGALRRLAAEDRHEQDQPPRAAVSAFNRRGVEAPCVAGRGAS